MLNYRVSIENYSKSHYIKIFKKKYKKAWFVTEIAIINMIERIDQVIKETTQAEVMMNSCDKLIVKLFFSVAGTNKSPKRSGNRAIVYVNRGALECRILLVYSKNQISSPMETQKWKKLIKSNYASIWNEFKTPGSR